MDGSDLLADIGKHLNIESRFVKNWRSLANKLEIPPEVYCAFDTSEAKVKSSTKEMFKWLAQQSPNLNVDDLLAALKTIGRSDLVDLVREETHSYFGEFKMKTLDLSVAYCPKLAKITFKWLPFVYVFMS